MRILHLTKYYPPDTGGIETFAQGLAMAQVEQGHAVRVLAHQARAGHATRMETLDGVEVVRARILGNIAFAPLSPWFFNELRHAWTDFRPDILHVHMPNVSAFAVFLGRPKARVVVHWHADVVTERQTSLKALYPFYAILEKKLLQRADRIIATSHPYLETSRPLQAFEKKCRVIPLGLDRKRVRLPDPKDVQRIRSDLEGRKLAIAVGRFSYYKGFEHLIRAAAMLPEVAVRIIGQGPMRKACQRLIQRLQLVDRVSLPGILAEDELWLHYAACDVLCLPSVERTEAFGMVLLEAMACGKPLITTQVAGSGMGFVNVHGLTGLQVPPADPAALAEALRVLIHDPEKARSMGQAGRKRFTENFAMDAVAHRIDELYAGL